MRNERGFSVVEIILAAAVFMILATGSITVVLQGLDSNRLGEEQAVANQYAVEGIEAVRSIKNQNFASLINTAGTGIQRVSNVWAFSGSNNIFDSKYTRALTVSDVQRDGGGNIVEAGGTLDKLTKKITSTVSWNFSPTRSNSVVLTSYLTDYRKPFIGNWALPSLESSFDLTSANSGNSNSNGISIAFANNKIYLGRENSGGSEFYIFDVSVPLAPSLLGKRDLNGDPNAIVIKGNYAYIASSDNSSELQIVDISNPATIDQSGKLTSVNLTNGNSGSNNANAISLSLSDSYLVMVRDAGDEFLIFDLANPSNPGNPIGRTSALTGNPNGVVTSGNYAYVASTNNGEELQIFDISNKSSPGRVATLNINSGDSDADALSLAVAGSYLLVGREESDAPELYSINISNPTTPTLSSTLELGADIRSIFYDTISKHAFLATNDNSNDFKVIDARTPDTLPGVLGQLNISNSPRQIVYDNALDRAFITSSDNSQELQIIKPQ